MESSCNHFNASRHAILTRTVRPVPISRDAARTVQQFNVAKPALQFDVKHFELEQSVRNHELQRSFRTYGTQQAELSRDREPSQIIVGDQRPDLG